MTDDEVLAAAALDGFSLNQRVLNGRQVWSWHHGERPHLRRPIGG
jgi:hypothetical protein